MNGVVHKEGQAGTPPNHAEPHSALFHSRRFDPQVSAEQPEDGLDFIYRAAPVVGREGIERQRADPHIGRTLNNPLHDSDSRPMPSRARQTPACGPTAIAVHDDGYMKSAMASTLQCKVTSQNFLCPGRR